MWMVWGLIVQEEVAPPTEISQLICEGANREFLITVAAIDIVLLLLALLWYWYLSRRLKWGPWVRWMVPLAVAVVVASALVAWNPVRSEALVACLESAEFSRFILLSNVAAIPRGLVLGGGGVFATYVGFFLVQWLIATVAWLLRKE
jgi:hypothetical protein